jgi:hypothetical protein
VAHRIHEQRYNPLMLIGRSPCLFGSHGRQALRRRRWTLIRPARRSCLFCKRHWISIIQTTDPCCKSQRIPSPHLHSDGCKDFNKSNQNKNLKHNAYNIKQDLVRQLSANHKTKTKNKNKNKYNKTTTTTTTTTTLCTPTAYQPNCTDNKDRRKTEDTSTVQPIDQS